MVILETRNLSWGEQAGLEMQIWKLQSTKTARLTRPLRGLCCLVKAGENDLFIQMENFISPNV